MYAHTIVASALALSATLALGAPAIAGDLPESGTIKVHSTFKGNFQDVQVAEKHVMGFGNGWGVIYNDAGSGPLHMGALMCALTYEDLNGSSTEGGVCAFGNAGGTDKIFVRYSGRGTDTSDQGTGTLTGGIGKYAGIKGNLAYQCKPVEPSQGLFACMQQFDYQLAAVR